MARFSTLTAILAAGGIIAGGVLVSAQPVGAVPPMAAITLEKQVGIDTGNKDCGDGSTLTVGLGTDVFYCYTVTNTGNVPLDTHDLVDDQFGAVVNDLTFSLAPGESTTVSYPTTARDTISNTATWTANNEQLEIFGVEATATATLTVTPPSISLDKTVMIDSGSDECGIADTLAVEAGTTVRYCYTVTNTGLTPLTEHGLVDDRLGTLLSGFTSVLDPGASTSVTETAVITDEVTNVATWTAENNILEVYDITATDELVVTIEVPPTTTTTTTTTVPPTTTTTTVPPTTTTTTVPPTTTTTSILGILPATGPTSSIPLALMLALLAVGAGGLALARSRREPAH